VKGRAVEAVKEVKIKLIISLAWVTGQPAFGLLLGLDVKISGYQSPANLLEQLKSL
jgi:hypothetical protein